MSKKDEINNSATKQEEEEETSTSTAASSTSEPFSLQFFEDTSKADMHTKETEEDENDNEGEKKAKKKNTKKEKSGKKKPMKLFGTARVDRIDYYSRGGDNGHPLAIDNEEDADLVNDLFSDTKFLTKDHTIENKRFIDISPEEEEEEKEKESSENENESEEEEEGREKKGEVKVKIEDSDEMVDVVMPLGDVINKGKKRPGAPAWFDEDDMETMITLNPKKLRKLRTEQEVNEKNEGLTKQVVVNGSEYQRRLRAQLTKINKKQNVTWATLPSEIKRRKQEAKKAAAAATAASAATRDLASAGGDNNNNNDFVSSSDSEDEDFEREDEALEGSLLRTTEAKVISENSAGGSKRSKPLRKGIIKIARLKDANGTKPSASVITALQFHPAHPEILMTGSLDRTVSLYQIDGKNNAHVSSVLFPDLPVCSAGFVSRSGDEIVVTGRRPFFYAYDVPTGKTSRIDRIIGREERGYPSFCTSPDGKYMALYGAGGAEAVVLSAQTKQLVSTLRMSLGSLRCATFNHDGTKLLASGLGGEVYEFDMRTMRCSAKYVDEGSLYCSAIAMSPGSKYLACGSNSGVVNVYSGDSLRGSSSSEATPLKPEKALMNITTPIDHVVFNHDAQILAMSSHDTFNCLRLVHLPSYTVFSNWPLNTVPLQHVSNMAFSPNSGFFAVGNNKGRVLTFRLFHYLSA